MGLGKDDQDKVIFLMLNNTEFLGSCMRKKITENLFSSEIRKKMVKLITNFYHTYGKSPGNSIAEIINYEIQQKRIREENLEMYIAYLEKMRDMLDHDISSSYLLDQLDLFIKERVVHTTINNLSKLKDRFGIEPERFLDIMRKAVGETDSLVGKQMIEAFSEDPIVSPDSDIVTKFNIKPIDNALGGGLKKGMFVVLLAYLGVGKSWATIHLAKMATRLGQSPLIIPLEMPNKMLRTRLKMSFTGMTTAEINRSPTSAKNIIEESLIKKTEILILSEEESSFYVDGLSSVLDEIESKHFIRPKLILLDSADDMLPPRGEKYSSKIEKSTAIYTYLKNFAKDNDICIVTTTQAQRRGESKWWLTSGTVGEDINKVRRATVGISLNAIEREQSNSNYKHMGNNRSKSLVLTKF